MFGMEVDVALYVCHNNYALTDIFCVAIGVISVSLCFSLPPCSFSLFSLYPSLSLLSLSLGMGGGRRRDETLSIANYVANS